MLSSIDQTCQQVEYHDIAIIQKIGDYIYQFKINIKTAFVDRIPDLLHPVNSNSETFA